MAALSAALLAAQVGSQFFAQRDAATNAINEGNYAQSAYNQNAGIADAQAQDAIVRGNQDASTARSNAEIASRTGLGAARANAGASGVGVNSGSALAAQTDFARQQAVGGALAALTIQNNAAREAWGYRTEGQQYRQQGALAARAGRNTAAQLRAGAVGTLLTGAAEGYSMARTAMANRGPNLSIPSKAPRGGYNVNRK